MNNQRNVSAGTGTACPPGTVWGGGVQSGRTPALPGKGRGPGWDWRAPCPPFEAPPPHSAPLRSPASRRRGAAHPVEEGGALRGNHKRPVATATSPPPPPRLATSPCSPRSQVVWVQIPSPHSPAGSPWASEFASPRLSILLAAPAKGRVKPARADPCQTLRASVCCN